MASDLRPPRVPLARVNQVLFGVKRRGGVSGRLSARESPDRSRERLAEGLGRDKRALDESTADARRRRRIGRKPRKNRAQTARAPTAGPSRLSVNRPPSMTRGGVKWLPKIPAGRTCSLPERADVQRDLCLKGEAARGVGREARQVRRERTPTRAGALAPG